MDRKRHVLIGAGGVSTAEDAYAKIRLGASLVQLLTALIYEGPGVVRRITHGLAELLARDGRAWRQIGDEQPSSAPVPAAVGRATAGA